jgi:hypothetical protein
MKWSLLLIASIILGCGGHKYSIVGAWKLKDGQVTNPGEADTGMRFHADGGYEYWFTGSKVKVKNLGNWELEGDTLTLNQTRFIATSGKIDETPKTERSRIRWISANEFEQIADNEVGAWIRKR